MNLMLNILPFLATFPIVMGHWSQQDNEVSVADEFNYLVMGGYRSSMPVRQRSIVSIRTTRPTAFFGDNHVCSGVLISVSLVLTAAHCVVDKKGIVTRANHLVVVVGTPLRLHRRKRTKINLVSSIIAHPKYKRNGNYNIAVLFLADVINMHIQSTKIAPVGNGPVPIGSNCTTLGWGQLFPDGPYSDALFEISLQIQPANYCKPKRFRSDHICALDLKNTEKRLCRGDSGVPLFCAHKLVGISAVETECSHHDHSGVQFVLITKYKSWFMKYDISKAELTVTVMSKLLLAFISGFYMFLQE